MQQYIDSHCHLSQSENFMDVFTHANNVGVIGCILNSTTESDWNIIENIANKDKNIRGAIGIHPWYVDTVSTNWPHELNAMLQSNPNLMLGEVGLDKIHGDFDIQEKVFICELELAIKYKRTINLHCVHAWDKMLNILKTYKRDLPKIIVHAFDGTQNAINSDIDLYFSYSPNISNPAYKKMVSSVIRVPKSKILIESDNTDLTKTIISANAIMALRADLSANDILQNTMGAFFNG